MAVINMLTIPFGALFYERKVPYHCSSCENKMRLYSTKDIFPLNDSMLVYKKHAVVCIGCKIKSDWRDLSRSKNKKESIKKMTENMIAFDGTEVFYSKGGEWERVRERSESSVSATPAEHADFITYTKGHQHVTTTFKTK